MRSFCPLRQAPKMGFCPLRLPFSGIPFWTSPAVFDDHYMSYIIYIFSRKPPFVDDFPIKNLQFGDP